MPTYKIDTTVNPFFLTIDLSASAIVNGLRGAYESAQTAARNTMPLTAALGTPTIQDAAAPLAIALFSVEANPGPAYFFVQGTGIAQGAGASGAFDFQATVNRYFTLTNSSPATALVPVQNSPFYSAFGTAWDVNSGSSVSVRFFWGVEPSSDPMSGAGGKLVFYQKLGSGANTQVMSVSDQGALLIGSVLDRLTAGTLGIGIGGFATGIQIGGASSNISLYGVSSTPQYNTTGTTVGFTAGVGTTARVDSTYTGDTGGTAYTVGDAIRALKLLGVMAV